MTKHGLDTFTLRRLTRFAREFREKQATLPTVRDFDEAGFSKATVDAAVRAGKLTEIYVTLTSGAIVKGYKASD